MNNERVIRRPNTSFIVRMWPSEGDTPEMRGEIENIATGERRMFSNDGTLMNLLQNWQREAEVVH